MNQNQIVQDLSNIRRIRKHYAWEPFMRQYNCVVICEIGIRDGGNFLEMIRHNPKLAVAVDSWIEDSIVARNDKGFAQEQLNQQYEDFKRKVGEKPFVKICREYSFEAVKHFEDNYFDLVYIDADHSYDGCLKDLKDWYPKVKKGGFLLGDDYRPYTVRWSGMKFGVVEAVNEFTKTNDIDFFELPNYGWGIIKK